MQDYILTRFNSLKLSAILATSSVMCPLQVLGLYTRWASFYILRKFLPKKGERVNTTKIIPKTSDARRFEAVSNLAVAIFENKTNNTIATNTVRAADGIRTPINESRSGRN